MGGTTLDARRLLGVAGSSLGDVVDIVDKGWALCPSDSPCRTLTRLDMRFTCVDVVFVVPSAETLCGLGIASAAAMMLEGTLPVVLTLTVCPDKETYGVDGVDELPRAGLCPAGNARGLGMATGLILGVFGTELPGVMYATGMYLKEGAGEGT